jgi:murein DD-endopeptidase MepM/ murein hydrolase activator NlpD
MRRRSNTVLRFATLARAIGLAAACLFLSALAQTTAQAGTPSPADSIEHLVARGETILSLASRYGTTVDAIAQSNGFPASYSLYPGQRLFIPLSGSSIDPARTKAYVIQPGETIGSVALRHSTTWEDLARLNRIVSPGVVHVGLVIRVPAVEPPSRADHEGIAAAHAPAYGGREYAIHGDDTLLRLSLRTEADKWLLVRANQLPSPMRLFAGRSLVLPSSDDSFLPWPFEFVEVSPIPVVPGATLLTAVHTQEPVGLTGQVFDASLRFTEEGDKYVGLAGVHAYTEPGLYDLDITAVDSRGEPASLTLVMRVAEADFGYEQIAVPDSRNSLLDPGAVEIDRKRLDEVRQRYTDPRLWDSPLERPTAGTVSSYFGTNRSYGGGPFTSYHTGVDFRSPNGTPVKAAATGVVVLAEPLVVHGNSVVIDHGVGVLSGYWHLSAIDVKIGDQVLAGDQIGRVGSTGLSTGAHLHWEMWVGGTSVDPLPWLDADYGLPPATH